MYQDSSSLYIYEVFLTIQSSHHCTRYFFSLVCDKEPFAFTQSPTLYLFSFLFSDPYSSWWVLPIMQISRGGIFSPINSFLRLWNHFPGKFGLLSASKVSNISLSGGPLLLFVCGWKQLVDLYSLFDLLFNGWLATTKAVIFWLFPLWLPLLSHPWIPR